MQCTTPFLVSLSREKNHNNIIGEVENGKKKKNFFENNRAP